MLDWLKVEINTPEKPEVFQMAQLLDMHPDMVFAKLFKVWSWFDQHSEDGTAPVTLRALLDSRAERDGFAEAMAKVGWLEIHEDYIGLPNFDRHVGKSAKKRSLSARRSSEYRANRNAKRHAKSNADTVTKSVTQNKNKNLKEGDDSPEDIKKQIFDQGLTLLADQGMKENAARGFLGKVVKEIGEADALRVIQMAKGRVDVRAYIAAASFKVQLPTDPQSLRKIRSDLGFKEIYYDSVDKCQAEILAHLRKHPEQRGVL